MIAYLGLGLLGSSFVRALLRRGETVHVWNRSPEKARALQAEGAKAFESPADAVRGASRIHLTLLDDAAVDEVLEKARPGFAPGVIVLDHTTTSPTGTAARAARFESQGIAFLHTPVFMGPANALDATGLMLASGPQERLELVRPELEKMTGKLVYLGADPKRAAAFKLFGNVFLIEMMTGAADLFALAKALDVPASEAATLFDFWKPGSLIAPRIKRMADGTFGEASFSLQMARKDVRLMLEGAKEGGVPLISLPSIAAAMDSWIGRGCGASDWTVIAKEAIAPRAKLV